MALNITQIETLVEDITDLQVGVGTNFDITPELFKAYVREGYQRIVSTFNRWPYFQATYSLTTVAEQRAYTSNFTKTAPTTVSGLTFGDIREIITLLPNQFGLEQTTSPEFQTIFLFGLTRFNYGQNQTMSMN